MTASEGVPVTAVLEVRHATKSFPGVKALDDVSLEIRKNEVVGLIGENGAGKSTLLKVLNGVYSIEAGEIRVNGRATPIAGPRDAFDHGIAMVFQEQSILTTLSVAENIFLGRENEFARWGVLDKAAMTPPRRWSSARCTSTSTRPRRAPTSRSRSGRWWRSRRRSRSTRGSRATS